MYFKKIHEKRKSGKGASKLLNNSGFTLLELIISIAILAVIIMPIMNMFSKSYKLNSDARTVQNTNDAASSIAETIRGADLYSDLHITGVKMAGTMSDSHTFNDAELGGLANMFSVSSTDIMPITKNGDDKPKLIVDNSGRLAFQINNYSSGGKKYDAVVSIDPNKVDNASTYDSFLQDRNKESITTSQATDHCYSEPREGAGTPLSEALNKIGESNPGKTVGEKSHKRSIDVYIEKHEVESNGSNTDYLSVRTVYKYDIVYFYTYINSDGYEEYAEGVVKGLEVPVKIDDIGLYSDYTDPSKGRKLDYYLFFNPDYEGTGLIKDDIVIHNDALNLSGNFYVIGETLPQEEIDEGSYSGTVEVIEHHPTSSKMNLNVKTNINRSHRTGNEGKIISSGIFRLINTYSRTSSDHFYVPVDLNDKNYNYVASSDAYRIYGYSVSVFLPTGVLHDVTTEKPVYEISGVRLR